MSCQLRETHKGDFVGFNSEPPHHAKEQEGVIEESLCCPRVSGGRLIDWVVDLTWQAGNQRRVSWFGLDSIVLAPPFLTSMRRSSNHCSTHEAPRIYFQWKWHWYGGRPVRGESWGVGGSWETRVGSPCLAGVCGIALILIFWWD